MANVVYRKAKQRLLDGLIDLNDAPVRVVLLETGPGEYEIDEALDDALADVPAGARVATSAPLTGKTITDGVFDADDVVVAAPASREVGAIAVYIEGATEADSYLVSYHDTGVGLPVTTTGGDARITWPATGIVRID